MIIPIVPKPINIPKASSQDSGKQQPIITATTKNIPKPLFKNITNRSKFILTP